MAVRLLDIGKKIGSDLQVRGNVYRVREAPDEEQ